MSDRNDYRGFAHVLGGIALFIIFVAIATSCLGGCHTVAGFGQDVKIAADGIGEKLAESYRK